MHYLGSKAKHANEILAITCANRRPDQIYVEPFVGGGNIINKAAQGAGRIANDKNFCMVALLDQLGNHGWVPPVTMTKAEWKRISKWKPDALTPEERALYAFAAIGPTFGSIWWGDFVEGERYRQGRDNALRDVPGLQGIKFYAGNYEDVPIPPNSLIYCDPPYAGTTDYVGSKTKVLVGEYFGKNNWKAEKFWQWADRKVEDGHTVFVSEYTGPAPSIYGKVWTPETTAEVDRLRKLHRATAEDDSKPSSELDEIGGQITAMEVAAGAAGAAKAARWQVVWEKEVAVNISAGSVQEPGTATKKVERLFHRSA